MLRAVPLAIRFLLGGYFVLAGVGKAGQTTQTLAAIYSYQIVLPDALANAIALTLPWAEIGTGLALIAAGSNRWVLGWTAAVLLFFTGITAQAWWRALPIDCGCVDLSAWHPSLTLLLTPGGAVVKNLLLLGLVGILDRWPGGRSARGAA